MNQIFQSGNKIAIFLNSPEYAKALIEKANIRDCTKIYCSDTDGNIGKLRKEGYKAADLFVSGEVLSNIVSLPVDSIQQLIWRRPTDRI